MFSLKQLKLAITDGFTAFTNDVHQILHEMPRTTIDNEVSNMGKSATIVA